MSPRPKEFDVDEALEKAMDAFWEHGFEATSLSDLTAKTGVQKASLYATFGDKRTLFLRALDHYQAAGLKEFAAELEEARSPRKAIVELFDWMVDGLCGSGSCRGCLMVNTAVELAPHDEEVARLVRKHERRMEAVLEKALERGKSLGEFNPSLDCDATAKFLHNVILGLNVSGKAKSGRKRLEAIVRIALRALDA